MRLFPHYELIIGLYRIMLNCLVVPRESHKLVGLFRFDDVKENLVDLVEILIEDNDFTFYMFKSLIFRG